MDPNLAVNSVISSYLMSSDAADERFRAALLRSLDDMCPDDASDLQHEMKARTLASPGRISFWYRLGIHDERLGRI